MFKHATGYLKGNCPNLRCVLGMRRKCGNPLTRSFKTFKTCVERSKSSIAPHCTAAYGKPPGAGSGNGSGSSSTGYGSSRNWSSGRVQTKRTYVGKEASGRPARLNCSRRYGYKIKVTYAKYGANCGRGSSQTYNLGRACNGKRRCDYRIRHRIIGDPHRGCAKNYVAHY